MHVYETRIRVIIPWALFLFSVFFYISNLCPTISWRDSPEFVTVSYNLDISHPAGSPAYSLSSKLLTLIPIGNIALRVNLFSAVSSSLCVALICILINIVLDSLESIERSFASLVGGLSIICSQAFNNFSLIAEVYTFQNCCLLVLLILSIKSYSYTSHSHLRFQYCFWFLYGISLGAHAVMAIYIPAFLVYDFISHKRIPKLKQVLFILFFSLFGFLVYLFLPLRSLSPLAFDWGDPETLHRFLSQIFDKKDSNKEIYYLINFSIFDLRPYISNLIGEFSIILCVVGVAGLIKLLINNFRVTVLLSLIFFTNILFFLNAYFYFRY